MDLHPIINGRKQLKALLRIRREIRKLLDLEDLPHTLDNGTKLYTQQDVDDRIQFLMKRYLEEGTVE